jgi:cobalt-zinc-cadmium efflux system membrane fusion protein
VKTADGFKPQPVSIGRSNRTHVEILEGLKPGQAYVAKGAFTLKAELQKESFGGDHGH